MTITITLCVSSISRNTKPTLFQQWDSANAFFSSATLTSYWYWRSNTHYILTAFSFASSTKLLC